MDISLVFLGVLLLLDTLLLLAAIVFIFRCTKGIEVSVHMTQEEAKSPLMTPLPTENLEAVQQALDKMELERRKDENKLLDLIGDINKFMTGGDTDAK